MTTLRVATLNLWGRNGPWPERLGLIRAELGRLSPRLVGLQEVMRDEPPGTCQAEEIAESLGYEVAYSPAATLRTGVQGNALLSSLPIRSHRTYPLPTAPGIEPRVLLYARVATEAGDLPVFVTHLDWEGDHGAARLAQVRFIAARVASLADGLPPVIMGDFNAEPDSDEIRYLRGLHSVDGENVCFADAWAWGGDGSAGETFSRVNDYARRARVPSRRIDYVFTGAEPVHTEVAFRTPVGEVWASDHFGLVSDVLFKT
ncbi:endonuclease/exonuclease/phosphatase family protein [Actinomadura sp. DC4]|uniref:endonuclease/exonuclease/phosphatase family protein n=1 Tax=Actinomadura sp. DC4 TaxID=3055069 RepID=UPI0025AF1197|nr:endonuclease/exonuclease/phosphatase family protein [Actinomadura sp. DC4]MDN3352038.1 endonuclease/exonuclease/phosphatase family protein [Actinomadura sp. DC4]